MRIQSKYSIGDTVFYDEPLLEDKIRPCPDCLGTKKWKAISPAGVEYEFNCPRCSGEYQEDGDHNLKYQEWTPKSRALTIGSVRFDSEAGVTYMCVETGVGAGTIYSEERLHETEQEAYYSSALICPLRNSDPDKDVSIRYNRTLRLCDYQLHLLPPKKKR